MKCTEAGDSFQVRGEEVSRWLDGVQELLSEDSGSLNNADKLQAEINQCKVRGQSVRIYTFGFFTFVPFVRLNPKAFCYRFKSVCFCLLVRSMWGRWREWRRL